jgi:lipoprotein-anchoring transpeptidase ErfK/SrfK
MRHSLILPRFRIQSTSMRRASLAIAGMAALLAGTIVDPADARRSRGKNSIEMVQSRRAGPPIMAVVSLSKQRVTIYDANGWIMRAAVSSGRRGYETPAGIYSVIQKEAEHYSNLYEDGYMPFMQRITWSGIALHGGPLPGYPASHGCVRMPVGFAERLFDLTRIGMRVIVARGDPIPAETSHPVLSGLNPARVSVGERGANASAPSASITLSPAKPMQTSSSIAALKTAEAEEAVRKADAARLNANKMTWEAGRLAAALRLAETVKARAEALLSAAESALETADSREAIQLAQDAKAKAVARLVDAEARLSAATLAAQSRPDVARARQEAETAGAEKTAALQAAAEAARKAAPVSVFISRKTQHLYVRQSFLPIFDMALTIRDPDEPIGTHIFTAVNYLNAGADIRWSVVSMDPKIDEHRPASSEPLRVRHRISPLLSSSASTAEAALDRIVIPAEAVERISELASPGSSLIISDEGISSETANDTDFVVLMSGEPQGGIKKRRRDPGTSRRYNRPYGTFWQW